MPKLNLNVLFFIKLIMWRKFNLLFLFIFFLISLGSCSRQKGYFSNYKSKINLETSLQEPELLATRLKYPLIQQVYFDPPAKFESINEVSEGEISQPILSLNVKAERDLVIQKKLYRKGVVLTIQKFKAQNKIADKKITLGHWEPRLKIGVTLLVIGIVLSIFGLGLIGGVSAFIGVLFTILGLLNTYY